MQPHIVALVVDGKIQEDVQGTVIDRIATWEKDQDGKMLPIVLIGVAWNELRTPNPSYHPPEQLAMIRLGTPEEAGVIDADELASILDSTASDSEKLEMIAGLLDEEDTDSEESITASPEVTQ